MTASSNTERGGGLEPEPVAQHAQRPLVVGVVAEHRLRRPAARASGKRLESPTASARSITSRTTVLASPLSTASGSTVLRIRTTGTSARISSTSASRRRTGPGGSSLARWRRAGADLDAARRRAGLVDRQPPAAAAAGRALGPQAGRPQAPVGAVEQHPVLGARPADLEREPLGEQRDRPLAVERRRQQQLGRRGRHAA